MRAPRRPKCSPRNPRTDRLPALTERTAGFCADRDQPGCCPRAEPDRLRCCARKATFYLNGVEVHLIVEGRQVFRSAEAPINPRAAKAFHARAERQVAQARALIEKVGGGRWYAYNPASGSRFHPAPTCSDDNALGPLAVDSPATREGPFLGGDT